MNWLHVKEEYVETICYKQRPEDLTLNTDIFWKNKNVKNI